MRPRCGNCEGAPMLNSRSQIVSAAVAVLPAAVILNVGGKEKQGVCDTEAELDKLIAESGFRNSIDTAIVEPAR